MSDSLFHENIVASSRIIYTPSVFARESLLHIQETGSLTARKPHTSKRKNLSSYLFFVVRSGSGTLSYNGQTHDLVPGDCVFVDCMEEYSHSTSDDLWSLSWVHFYGQNMPAIYEKYISRGGSCIFHPVDLVPIEKCLGALYKLADSDDYIRDMRINEALSSLLSLIMEESWNPEHSVNSSLQNRRMKLKSVAQYLDVHYSESISLEELSGLFGFNKFYLTRIFKEQFGMSIGNYILHSRISRAKNLLRFSDMTVDAISQETGMGDPSYFSRMFRKIEGISPSEYRHMW